MGELPILEQAKQKFSQIVREKDLLQEHIKVEINPLSPRQAIGTPIRQVNFHGFTGIFYLDDLLCIHSFSDILL